MFRLRASLLLTAASSASTPAPGSKLNYEFVKQLRILTEASMGDIVKAIKECGNDVDTCVAWLRKRGAARVVKTSAREALAGLLLVGHVNSSSPALNYAYVLEVNCETDFAARSPNFRRLLETARGEFGATAPPDIGGLRAKLADDLVNVGSTLGEKIDVRALRVVQGGGGAVGSYAHSLGGPLGAGIGSVAAMVGLVGGDGAKMEVAACGVARHMVATMGIHTYPYSGEGQVPIMKQKFMDDDVLVGDWLANACGEGTVVHANVLIKCGDVLPTN